MAIDEATVAKVARLARVRIPDGEGALLARELSEILVWIEQLGEVDTAAAAPMSSAADVPLRRRPDEVTDGNRREDMLGCAPETHAGFFTVPKVVE